MHPQSPPMSREQQIAGMKAQLETLKLKQQTTQFIIQKLDAAAAAFNKFAAAPSLTTVGLLAEGWAHMAAAERYGVNLNLRFVTNDVNALTNILEQMESPIVQANLMPPPPPGRRQ